MCNYYSLNVISVYKILYVYNNYYNIVTMVYYIFIKIINFNIDRVVS